MEYTVIINDRSYDLPKKTLDVADKLDSVMKVDGTNLNVRQKFEKLHCFIKDIVGEDNAREIFGSDKLTEIDLSELTLSVRKVIDAYEKPISDYDAEKNMKSLDSLPIEKIISLGKAADKIVSIPSANK